jgi:hypothetical protein
VTPVREGEPDEREDGRHQAEREERELPPGRDVGELVDERVVRTEENGEQREGARSTATV